MASAEPQAPTAERARRPRYFSKVPKPEDALPAGTCQRCGFVAAHPTPAHCISALRDALADLTGDELRGGRGQR